MARTVRAIIVALPRFLPAEPGQPALRPASSALVRAEPPGRGFRRDLRDLAHAALELAAALRRMAGAQEAAICRRADGRAGRQEAVADETAACRSAQPAQLDAGRALSEEARALRDRSSDRLRPRPAAYLFRSSEASPLAGSI